MKTFIYKKWLLYNKKILNNASEKLKQGLATQRKSFVIPILIPVLDKYSFPVPIPFNGNL